MVFAADDRTRLRRQRAEQAIQLAMQGQWEEAANVNRIIIDVFPNDVDAYNRLGKALTELGRYGEAREAYGKALGLDPHNSIAQKNLARLSSLGEVAAPRAEARTKLSPQLFISETGKTGVTALTRPAVEVAARLTAGDEVFLRRQNSALMVENAQGEYLGEVEPKLSLRLIKLIEGGNRYAAAIATLARDNVRIIIKETYQHPSQAGKLSFPATTGEAFRPYIKEGLVRNDADEEEESFEEGEDTEDWGGGRSTKDPGADVTLYEFAAPAAKEPEEEEEEFEEE
ncbi:MAG TPA: tetratricopeptide repeat protein [Dehalococcoidia bacterium]|nr:tetratricopeptide repeat protein [Dehalococcoidia bacterium]